MRNSIPFNRLTPSGPELANIQSAIDGMHTSGDGPFTKRCEAHLADRIGASRVLLTTSCTHALEMSALLLDVGPGDEVIVPAFTFVSTANAFALRGARIVFADVRADTLNLDESLLKDLISPRTKAIVPVHYAGVGCEMRTICTVAREADVAVVEDNAHGLFGGYKGQPLGSFGELATQSFHETKNITCGEGGALIINDETLIPRAEVIREKGTNRSQFFRGEVDKYTWVDLGSSYVMSDLLAAFLWAQLQAAQRIQERRREVWEAYYRGLEAWARASDVGLPIIPPHCTQPYHMFYAVLPTAGARDGLIAHLRERRIHAVFHYLPLHLSTMGIEFGGKAGDCPVTEDISARLVRLPFYCSLTPDQQERVIQAVLEAPL
ncbi:MAG: dTDP-4-amino-4,6-dideoxygalactose transaminase [Armatimonadia bacterium]|nr:dTDP-4-amino-4,6-dideoxygalactose transaminase [Armatimonadia bacterium]